MADLVQEVFDTSTSLGRLRIAYGWMVWRHRASGRTAIRVTARSWAVFPWPWSNQCVASGHSTPADMLSTLRRAREIFAQWSDVPEPPLSDIERPEPVEVPHGA